MFFQYNAVSFIPKDFAEIDYQRDNCTIGAFVWPYATRNDMRMMAVSISLLSFLCVNGMDYGYKGVAVSEEEDVTCTTLSGHTGSVCTVVCSPILNKIASGGADATIKIWDIEKEKEVQTLVGHQKRVNALVYNWIGSVLTSGSDDGTIRVWKDGKATQILQERNGAVNALAAHSYNGNKIVSGFENGTIQEWDIETAKEIRTLKQESGVTSLQYNGLNELISASKWDGAVKIWDVRTNKKIKTLTPPPTLISVDTIESLMVNPKKSDELVSGFGNRILVWNIPEGKMVRFFGGHTKRVNSVQFNPDGNEIVSGSQDGTIKIWNASTGKEQMTVQHNNKGHSVNSVIYYLKEPHKIISVASYDGTVKVWNRSLPKVAVGLALLKKKSEKEKEEEYKEKSGTPYYSDSCYDQEMSQ